MPDGAIGIQSAGAIVLTAGQLTDDMLLMQVVTPGVPLSGITLGELKSYINGSADLINDFGLVVLGLVAALLFPDDPTGLPPGGLWNDGLAIGIVPGAVRLPGAPPLFFNGLTARTLFLTQGANLPLNINNVQPDQLWNNGNILSVGV